MAKDPDFLTLAEVVEIHTDQISRYGGKKGIRDIRLVESAIAQPEATYAGEWLHTDLYEMAAAYAFHICQNHPFLDGNKRTALASALVFLEINGVSILDHKQELLGATNRMASGHLNKLTFADLLRKLKQ